MSSVPPRAPADGDPPPALTVGHHRAVWLSADGEIAELGHAAAATRARAEAPLVCHAPSIFRRLGGEPFRVLDLLELFAFVRPARFCLPTPRGLADALELARPRDLASEAETLILAARVLLDEAAALDRDAAGLVFAMGEAGWPWAAPLLRRLGMPASVDTAGIRPFAAWERLPQWEEQPPAGPPRGIAIHPNAARKRLADMLGEAAERRPQQADYASAVSAAFLPREKPGEPAMVLAEAGTGVGKTLGYLAPATLWAEANGAPVWVSTYTRNLQHQIDAELDRLYPDRRLKEERVVIRKGRENYLCLLNFEEAARATQLRTADKIPLGLLARWVARTRDGDLQGGDLPAWLADLVGRGRTLGLADRRGECIYAACPHYGRCFIERQVRRARQADVVVANHALVMANAAVGGLDDAHAPTRYVFDEGHHLFDAADSAFAAALTGREARELRRWALGAEGRRDSRARGLRRRLEDLLPADEDAAGLLDRALRAAASLPGEGWLARLAEGVPQGPAEIFLAAVRTQVLARAAGAPASGTSAATAAYDLECEVRPPVDGLADAARALDEALGRMAEPLKALRARLLARLDDEAEDLETQTRQRIEGIARSLLRRADHQLAAWRAMLAGIESEADPAHVDWLALVRMEGRELDVGMHRHWIDPTVPFAAVVAERAHGLVVTSATLRDAEDDPEAAWRAAERRTGAAHMPAPAIRAATPSPFDYAARTRVLLVRDVRLDSADQVAAAYRELFLAARGGGLGLFTAIARLRAVHGRIAGPLEDAGLPLYAQHVDRLDTTTLIEIFRAEDDACLLGTDAVRDGVDVPGRPLRLIVFDRVPWPRPDILHKARRTAHAAATGGPAGRYDDMIARLRLRQAFGRLIRRGDDAGVFVMLDPRTPSRLLSAFPEGVEPRRVGLAEAIAETRTFLDGAF